jgi:pSer/pThr/pTyr-binding forkhead associated (FHA) protein
MFKLVIQDDEGKTTVVPLIRDEITIGRKEGNTIRLTERNVSRRHARILRNNGEVQIEDLGSYNGIRVNNARIAERVSLRVSDQVQIGDYKLYLKAEGVEQVDDARTMPIERIENALPTEVMPAMGAPTTPMAAQGQQQVPAIPGTPPAPNRSPVAVADTDPAGRPVATAAQVAALTQPAGYGKLVVVSSNFAGKEFDLTRPQMIIGRTDENDIVVNHRSISRNHAKVTRDPETGRYTNSDLQSSNGVRVNGQDYGKVEMRRGDTVDLGHVRLRFVEPGEDFVFARDAVIADVPESGSKKTLFIVAAAVILLGIGGAYVVMSGKDAGTTAGGGTQKGSMEGPGSDTQVAVGPGSDTVEGPGSGGVQVQTPDTPDAPHQQVTVTPANDEAARIKVECQQHAQEKHWADAGRCAEGLMQHDPKTAKALREVYKQELANELSKADLDQLVNNKKDLRGARKKLAEIEQDSIYRKPAEKQVDDLEDTVVARFRSEAMALKQKKQCGEIERLIGEARDAGGPKAAAAVASQKCTSGPEPKDCSDKLLDGTKACKAQFCKANPSDKACGSGPITVTPPVGCDAEELKEEGVNLVSLGQHAAALAKFEASLKCKFSAYVLQLAFMEACASTNSQKAIQFYKQLSPAQQQKFAQMCIRTNTKYQP